MQHIFLVHSTFHITPPCNKPGEAKGASEEIFDFFFHHHTTTNQCMHQPNHARCHTDTKSNTHDNREGAAQPVSNIMRKPPSLPAAPFTNSSHLQMVAGHGHRLNSKIERNDWYLLRHLCPYNDTQRQTQRADHKMCFASQHFFNVHRNTLQVRFRTQIQPDSRQKTYPHNDSKSKTIAHRYYL